MLPALNEEKWLLVEEGWDAERQNVDATLFCLSNGSFAVRGNLEEMPAGAMTGVYLGGVFDRGESWSPDMVNLPNFLPLEISAGGRRFGIETAEVVAHRRVLDFRQGVLVRRTVLADEKGRRLRWESARVVSIAHPELCAERHVLTMENFSGPLTVCASIDGDQRNFDSFYTNPVNHLIRHRPHRQGHDIVCLCRLMESRFPVVVASRVLWPDGAAPEFREEPRRVRVVATLQAAEEEPIVLERFSTARSHHHSRDENELLAGAAKVLAGAQREGFDGIASANAAAMDRLWEEADFRIEGDELLQRKLRFNLFELIRGGPRHTEIASMGARGLTGERYRGHVYWDTEMFMLPFYVFTDPPTARNILLYRYHTLDGARRFAAMSFGRGARYSQQAADTGDDGAPPFAPSTDKLEAGADLNVPWFGRIELHVTAAVAYGVMLYVRATGDHAFLRDYGLEILAETARWWCSRMDWVEENHRWELLGVIGPDEWHLDVDNNAYTNYLVWFNLDWAIRCLEEMTATEPGAVEALREKIALTDEDVAEWIDKRDGLYLPQPDSRGIIPQQDGWFDLKPFDKGDLGSAGLMTMLRIGDVIPNALGGTVDTGGFRGSHEDYQILHQADLVLLLCLFPDLFDEDIVRANYDYYERQTVHKSSLSPNTYSIVATRLGRGAASYDCLDLSASVDLDDIQRNGAWGLHYAAIGGTWMAAAYGFGGICLNKDFELELRPALLKKWKSLAYRFCWHGRRIGVRYDGREVRLKLLAGEPIDLTVAGHRVKLTDEASVAHAAVVDA